MTRLGDATATLTEDTGVLLATALRKIGIRELEPLHNDKSRRIACSCPAVCLALAPAGPSDDSPSLLLDEIGHVKMLRKT
ncbi:hypothetical protein CSOJ01_09541 [Colletotrichum sojae]|uniref:Uncharacterized protein n=1 Tax=Colletotrichum sojae TaxID=2175907 RepID=A0A8H6J3G8_9PEZI|nr:hypothetical protein CSOJ01_09541 [Colletotrichum sojae]